MPENTPTFDLAVIGGGPGGYIAAIRAAQLGVKTALIEKNRVGGTCLHQGCIPTKVLLQSADLYYKILRSGDYGIYTEGLRIDYQQSHRRKEGIIKRLFQGIQFLLKKNGVTVFEGQGLLDSPNNILIRKNETGTVRIMAKNIILATGSYPFVPDSIKYDGKYVLTSDDVLLKEEIPGSIIIAGAGAVGVEFAYLFNVLGSKVTIVELLDDVLPGEDVEISAALRKIFKKRGIEVLTGTSLEKVEINDGVTVEIHQKASDYPTNEQQNTISRLKADYLLLALGRRPALTDLGIENISLEFKGKYLQVNETMETSQKGIYAIGDITGPPLLAHKASNEGKQAVSCICGKETVPINYQNIPRVTYCLPQIASMGLSQAEAERKGYSVRTGKFPFSANSKALIEGEYEEGFIKIVTDKTYGEILGVHAIGPHVGELMWGTHLATILEGTAFELSNAIFPHPTLSESLMEAALAAVHKPIHMP